MAGLLPREVQGSRRRDSALGKQGAACPRSTAAETPLQRASMGQELSRAMQRMGMGSEQEYCYDIFWNLMEQPRHTVRASDMPHTMTAEGRALLVDWLVQVHEYLKLADDTLHLAVYLMNAYLKASKVRVATLQLLSITCLFLACKVEESTCPQSSQLCLMAEDTFTPKELFRMERKVLACLRFELHYANPVALLHLIAEVGSASPEVQHMAMYFMELSLMEADAVGVEPARLSMAALRLAQRVLGEGDPAGSQLPQECSPRFHLSSVSELSAVYRVMIQAAMRGSSTPLRATFQKFARPQKLCISISSALGESTYLRHFLGSPAP
ncbi:cyclin-P isoform X2 [Paroedura picta]|uniref:cyclin-P isoform X2 n=1 Tax=Paroedura picta TaxID=143630 RepID=UPI004056C5F7